MIYLEQCDIVGNLSAGFGGAAFCDWEASIRLSDCGNAGREGAGLHCSGTRALTLTNSVIAGNDGFGVFVTDDAAPTLNHCTVVANTGGGVFCIDFQPFFHSTASIRNSIVQGLPPDCASIRNSLFGADTLLFVRSPVYDFDRRIEAEFRGDQIFLVDFIADEGDFHLRPDSPATGNGSVEGAAAVDLDGHGRACDGSVDLGAYELEACAAPTESFRRADANADGVIDIGDVVGILFHVFLGQYRPPCEKSADIDDNGKLEVQDPLGLLRYLYLRGLRPAPPFWECGFDPTLDDLPCGVVSGCG